MVEELGAGGNGVVWRASKTGRSDCAIKILRNLSPETFQRFRAEVEALSEAEGIDGVIPMLDFEIPDDEKIELRWLRMPLAEPFNPEPQTQKMSETVQRFLDLAVTLQQLHLRQMYHRDIKPQNILVYKGRLCFADFGLVKFEKRRSGITPSRRDVGPKFVMAPEMRRTARTAAGGPADVYSFMKTLWIALTNERLGFDGQYVTGSSLSLKNYLPGSYTTTIDELLVECTDNDPEARPRIDHVIGQLRQWLVLTEDFHRRNLREWTEVEGKLFPASVPSRASWTNVDDVCAVLRLVADINSLNHMFMPTGGGMTVTHVRKSEVEAGFLVLEHGYLTVMKPKRLSYESFGPGSEWNYFRLEAAITSPSRLLKKAARRC